MPSQGTSRFDLFALRFHFQAPAPILFPPSGTPNLFRGHFGKTLYRRDPEAYARIFKPVRTSGVPSGFRNPPRPFVLRVEHLGGTSVDRFLVGLNLFDPHSLEIVRSTMVTMVRERFGAELIRVDGEEPLSLSLVPKSYVDRARVTFHSLTELKNATEPGFGVLFAAVRDRISNLSAFYGSGPLNVDFRALGERAAAVKMTDCDIQYFDAERVSGGKSHPIGGFIGFADYEGDLTEFIPYLEIASYTGIGRQTVWGKGQIFVQTF